MEYRIKVTNWMGLGESIVSRAKYYGSSKVPAFYYSFPEVPLKGLPDNILIPSSMDLVKELSYFAPTNHDNNLPNNIIEFIWKN